jgi:Ca2+-binding EF-hand superfamily protein
MGCGVSGQYDRSARIVIGHIEPLKQSNLTNEEERLKRRAFLEKVREGRAGKLQGKATFRTAYIEKKIEDQAKNNIDAFILKFPVVKKSFQILQSVFAESIRDKSKQVLHAVDFLSAVQKLDVNWTLNQIDVDEKIESALHRKISELTFKQFLQCICLIVFLRNLKEGEKPDEKFAAVHLGVIAVENAFAKLDDNGDGFVQVDELRGLVSGVDGRNDVLVRRLQELDQNKDGTVEFSEFLVGIMHWVGLTDASY